MIDVDALKRNLDCRILVERDLGKPKYRTHEYSTFKYASARRPSERQRRSAACSAICAATFCHFSVGGSERASGSGFG